VENTWSYSRHSSTRDHDFRQANKMANQITNFSIELDADGVEVNVTNSSDRNDIVD